MEHYTWEEMEKEVMSDLITRRIITGDKAMVAQVFIAKGAVVPEHRHESEQITYIMEGALKFELEGREVVVSKGQVLRIPSNVPHRAVALEDTLDLDIFSPIRHDWLAKVTPTCGVEKCMDLGLRDRVALGRVRASPIRRAAIQPHPPPYVTIVR